MRIKSGKIQEWSGTDYAFEAHQTRHDHENELFQIRGSPGYAELDRGAEEVL